MFLGYISRETLIFSSFLTSAFLLLLRRFVLSDSSPPLFFPLPISTSGHFSLSLHKPTSSPLPFPYRESHINPNFFPNSSMTSGKSQKGRGGSSRRSRKENSGHRISSTSSTPMTATTASPPSVTRRPLPPQYSDHPDEERYAPEPSRFSQPTNLSRGRQPSRSHSSSQRLQNQLQGVQEPEPSVHREEPNHPVNLLDHAAQSESSEHEDTSESDEEGDANQHHGDGEMTLNQLLAIPGRDQYLPRLSLYEGEGLWCVYSLTLCRF